MINAVDADKCRYCVDYWQDMKFCTWIWKFIFDPDFEKAERKCRNADLSR